MNTKSGEINAFIVYIYIYIHVVTTDQSGNASVI